MNENITQQKQQLSADQEVEKRRENMQIKVNGMMCSHCESRVNKAVGALDGVFFVSADSSKGIVDVEFDKDKVTLEQIKMAIVEQDYEVV